SSTRRPRRQPVPTASETRPSGASIRRLRLASGLAGGAVRAAAEVFSTWRSPGERLLPALAERTADPAGAVRAYATHVLAAAGEELRELAADILGSAGAAPRCRVQGQPQ
ncbi:hypothetical protein, partial [Actinoallomurus oryzae]|uniref:hypothetical protein n=1 Tax=Actinoallomurus oryzae TaxID=502180 RepID=UPI0031E8906B